MSTSRWCEHCQRAHAPHEVCPYQPGFIQLLGMWMDGDRQPLTIVAMVAFCVMMAGLIGAFAALVTS